jgi:pyruvate formate lyase activating enzyme
VTARVLNIQRMSTDDGPGLRTTVFFKGCSLACTWCHNPESLDTGPELVVHESRCIACGTCAEACPNGAVARDAGAAAGKCLACGTCARECPAGARELLGTAWTVEGLVAEVARDRAYFDASGGGVTASGGEPAVQAAFVEGFLAACRDAGLHTALDTCGMCGEAALLRMARHASLVMFDVKEMDPGRHRAFTGKPNDTILANLRAVSDAIAARDDGPRLWIRTPLIPGATATDGNIRGIGRLLAGMPWGRVARWDLCAFNNLCRDQYRRLGREWTFARTELMTRAEVDSLAAVARSSGVDPAIVHASGATRLEAS